MHTQPLVSKFPKSALGADYEGKTHNEPVFSETNGADSNLFARSIFHRRETRRLFCWPGAASRYE
jgi:hypothetical protein